MFSLKRLIEENPPNFLKALRGCISAAEPECSTVSSTSISFRKTYE